MYYNAGHSDRYVTLREERVSRNILEVIMERNQKVTLREERVSRNGG